MPDRPLVAGVDTSTQSCKVVVCDAETGEVVRTGRASHPDGTEVDPRHWWDAWREASGDGILDGVSAIAVGGQQHGMVLLDEHGEVVRPALLWNDTRSAQAADDLVAELGAQAWADATGLVPVAATTVSKLRWMSTHEPDNLARARTHMIWFYETTDHWLSPEDPNYPCIARIIRSLRLLAGDHAADGFQRRIHDRIAREQAVLDAESLRRGSRAFAGRGGSPA